MISTDSIAGSEYCIFEETVSCESDSEGTAWSIEFTSSWVEKDGEEGDLLAGLCLRLVETRFVESILVWVLRSSTVLLKKMSNDHASMFHTCVPLQVSYIAWSTCEATGGAISIRSHVSSQYSGEASGDNFETLYEQVIYAMVLTGLLLCMAVRTRQADPKD